MALRLYRRTRPIRVALYIADRALRADIADACEDAGIAVAVADDPTEHADVAVTDRPIETAVPLIALVSDYSGEGWPAEVQAAVPPNADAATLAAVIVVVAAGYALAPRKDSSEDSGKGTSMWADADDSADEWSTTLTAREREVVALLAEGASNKEIARALALSVHTVKFHVASLMGKLGARSRAEAVAIAIRAGLAMM